MTSFKGDVILVHCTRSSVVVVADEGVVIIVRKIRTRTRRVESAGFMVLDGCGRVGVYVCVQYK